MGYTTTVRTGGKHEQYEEVNAIHTVEEETGEIAA